MSLLRFFIENRSEALQLIMQRNGYPEETYYTFSYSPIPNDQGEPGGIFCANTDDTEALLFGLAGFLASRDLGSYQAAVRSYLRDLWDRWWPHGWDRPGPESTTARWERTACRWALSRPPR